MSSSFKFPIPDWGDDVFKYPGTNVNGKTIIKSNKKKRKHDSEDMLGKCETNVDKESQQGKSKKKKSDKSVTIPDDKMVNGTKQEKKTQTTKILSPQKNNLDVSTIKKKRKRNKKNNKYKELNERQKEERMAKADAVVGKSESCQEGTVMKVKKSQDNMQLLKKKEKTQQHSEHDSKKKKKKSKLLHKEDDNDIEEKVKNTSDKKIIKKNEETHHDDTELNKKKKKKKEKILNHSNDNLFEDNTDNQEKATDTSHHNTSHDMSEIETPHSQTKKKKKSTSKLTDTIILNGKETKTSHENENQQNAFTEKAKKKKKNKDSNKKRDERTEILETSPSAHEPEMGNTENEAKRKKKRKEILKKSDELLNGKDSVSNTKKTKMEKLKNGGKSSKKVKEVKEEQEEEELLFDGDEECSESFKKDLGDLLSSLNFGDHQTKGSKKRKNNGDAEINDGCEILETDSGIKAIGKEESLKKKRKKKKKKVDEEEKEKEEEYAKSSPKKISVEKSYDTGNKHATPVIKKVLKFDRKKVAKLLEEAASMEREKPNPPKGNSLKERMEERLMAARFRMVNQELYTKSSSEAKELFKKDPIAFDIYHKGYQAQVKQWPVNPVDIIIKWLSNRAKELVVADMGCGEGTLSQRVPQTCVHSLDLVASNPWVTPCDMAHTPLGTASVDVVVFCLSLMGTNIKDFMMEANRILKSGGILKIAEVESRFSDVKEFEKDLVKYGFHCTGRDTSHKYFFILDFKKTHKLKKAVLLPDIILKPCLYKKR